MDNVKLPVYVVTIGVPAGEYVIEVPTFQGADAAGRRARMGVWALNPKLDLRAIVVTSSVLMGGE